MRKQTSSLLAISFLLVPVFSACGSDKGHTPITGTVEDFAKAVCTFAFRCCSAGEVAYYVAPFVDAENCTERLMDAALAPGQIGLTLPASTGGNNKVTVEIPNLGALDRAVREKRTRIDAAALKVCKDYLASLSCNAPIPQTTGPIVCEPNKPPPEANPCDPSKIFVGNLKEGDVCTSDGPSYECASGLYCARNGDLGEEGQCIASGHVGDFCMQDSECDEGLYCSMLDGTCQAPRQEGETCVYADHLDPTATTATLLVKCREDLSCDAVTHTCVVHCQQGAPCSSDDDCDKTKQLLCILDRCDLARGEGLPCGTTDDCQDGLRCIPSLTDPTKLVCAARLADSLPCSVDTDCQSNFCDYVSSTTPMCAPQKAAGLPCPTGLNQQCQNGICRGDNGTACTTDATCNGGACNVTTHLCQAKCYPLKPDDAQCATDSECQSTYCIAGYCRTPPLADGVGCDSDGQCQSEFCGLETKRVCTELPLPINARCDFDEECDSLLCIPFFGVQVCTAGASAGDKCGSANPIPCDPKTVYCDTTMDLPECVPFHETGESCIPSQRQCRGSCVLKDNRYICDDTPKPGTAVCDGQ